MAQPVNPKEGSFFGFFLKSNSPKGDNSQLPLNLGIGVIIAFLLVASLTPEIGKFGLLALRQQLIKVFAAEPVALEAETGTVVPPAILGTDSNVSGGSYIQFGTTSVNFQPSAPYYATFYYQWYKNSQIVLINQ